MDTAKVVDDFFAGLVKVQKTRVCVECGRVFHMDDPSDAVDFYAGHDCEE